MLEDSLIHLKMCYKDSPHPSFKVTNYFNIYNDLFAHLRGTECTFVEIGVLHGGSLFMWKKWLGERARIVGIDLNPAAKKWEKFGFEIFVGDQGDPEFWRDTLPKIGQFDVLLDDGGHQSFQQIVTLSEALKFVSKKCTIVIEDTCTSFFKEFSGHRENSFLNYAKDSTDLLLAKTNKFFAGQFPNIRNCEIVEKFQSVYSINFFSGIVAYKVDPLFNFQPELLWNRMPQDEAVTSDFRYNGKSSALVDWPEMFVNKKILVEGGEI